MTKIEIPKSSEWSCDDCLIAFLVEQEPSYDEKTWMEYFDPKRVKYCPFCGSDAISEV